MIDCNLYQKPEKKYEAPKLTIVIDPLKSRLLRKFELNASRDFLRFEEFWSPKSEKRYLRIRRENKLFDFYW